MKKLIYFSLIAMLLSTAHVAEAQQIFGFVRTEKGAPLDGASVFVSNIGEDKTDANGRYSIDLSSCIDCKPGFTVAISVNSKHGYKQLNYTIPNGRKQFDIEVPRNSKLILKGKVKDKKTGKFVSGIKVTPIITDYEIEIPSVITDSRGYFQFIINKTGIGSRQAIELIVTDVDGGKYSDTEEIVFIDQLSSITIELEECDYCGMRETIEVNSFFRSNIPVEPGDIVTINASGVMKVGNFVGNSGPEGLPNNRGVLGMSLSGYNYFENWNHAVLVYRFGEKDEWKFYDSRKKNNHLIQQSGYIEFGVNDKQTSDNSGAYEVEVIVKK